MSSNARSVVLSSLEEERTKFCTRPEVLLHLPVLATGTDSIQNRTRAITTFGNIRVVSSLQT